MPFLRRRVREISEREAERLRLKLESARSSLPEHLAVQSLDSLAATSDDACEAQCAAHGVGVLTILQLIIAAWPLIRAILDLARDADREGEE